MICEVVISVCLLWNVSFVSLALQLVGIDLCVSLRGESSECLEVTENMTI